MRRSPQRSVLLVAVSLVTLALLASEARAAREPQLLLVAGVQGAIPRAAPVSAKLGQPVRVFVVFKRLEGRRWRLYSDAAVLRLGWRRYRRGARGSRALRPLSALGPHAVRWYRVEPQPHHVATPPPNAGNPAYSNARLFGPKHGTWLGYDTLEYLERPIAHAKGGLLEVKRTKPSHPRVDVNGGLGTMRYKATLRLADGSVFSTWGKESVGKRGILPRVLRLTFRSGDDYVGHLRGFFNVPNVFGSGGHGRRHQTELYQGADCADVIVGALRAAGAKIPYTSVRGLSRYTRPLTGRLLLTKTGLFTADGKTPANLAFGAKGLRSGDIMLIDYKGFSGSPRAWDHVAVVDRDEGTKGRFDAADPILHMGYLYGLTEETAAGEAPAYVRFIRLRRRYRRAMARKLRRRRR